MCTSLKITSTDKAVIIGRTMDYPLDLSSKIAILPRRFKFQGKAPGGKPGLTWEGKYGAVGMNAYGFDCMSDGINEAGLYFSIQYLPGYSEYPAVPEGQDSKALSQLFDVGNFLLSTCANVNDVKNAMQNVIVWQDEVPQVPEKIGLHYAIHDADGGSIVVEYLKGQLRIYDNPVGALTNSPPFEWQLINLGNYLNLSPINASDKTINNYTIKTTGQGSGMIGLPGDTTPVSRFVRATAISQSALPTQNGNEAEVIMSHLLGNLYICKGFEHETAQGRNFYGYTQWYTISNLKERRYIAKYYENPAALQVNLSEINFDKPEITHINAPEINWATNVSNHQS